MTEEDMHRRIGGYYQPDEPEYADSMDSGAVAAPPVDDRDSPADPFVPGHALRGRWSLSDPKTIRILGLALVLVLMISGFAAARMYFGRDKVTGAKAGDCLQGNGIDGNTDGSREVNLKIVECHSSDAKYRVVGRFENKPESEANTSSTLCNPYPDTQFIYWEGVPKRKGTILCLALNKK